MKHRTERTLRRGLAAILLLLALLALTACEGEEPRLVDPGDPLDPYAPIALEALAVSGRKAPEDNAFAGLRRGDVVECFDAQAIPAVRQGVGSYWYPQCLATVIIAVDRAQTDAVIHGWRDLTDCGERVAWNWGHQDQRLLLAAAAYGLEGPDYTKTSALELMKALERAGRFDTEDRSAPVQVCFDYQAVALIHSGRDLELVVPQEGTFTYTLGLLSEHLLMVPADGALLSAGLRLTDGRCEDPAYPPEEDYAPAVEPEDYGHLQEVTRNSVRDIRRGVCRSRLYSSADNRESVMYAILGIVGTLIWMGTAMHRATRPDLRRATHVMALLVVGWLLVRLFKYELSGHPALGRLCWYSYYIFQLALPLVLLYIALVIDRSEREEGVPGWFRGGVAVYGGLVALVLTNDLHQLVFRFVPGEDWSEHYSYGPGYYLIFAVCILAFAGALFLLVRKSRKSPKRLGWIWPVTLGGVIVAYAAGYCLGIPLARDSDFTMTFCFFSLCLFESALQTGLIPANTRYGELFSSSPLNMQLLDRRGRMVLASAQAAQLEPVVRVQLSSQPTVEVSRDGGDTLLFGHSIRGGTVVWQEDRTALNRLYREVQTSVRRLKAANGLLRRESEVRRRRVAADVKAELFDSLEREIEAKTHELTGAIGALSQAEDRDRQTAYITLLLCHIKRRCNLFFLAQEGFDMPGDELAIYLDELSEFAGYAGVKALVRCAVPRMMNVRRATLCYDFYFAALAWSAQGSRDTLLGRLEQQGDGLTFSLLAGAEAGTFSFPPDLLQRAEDAGGSVFSRDLEESTGLYLVFPKGGEGA